MTLIISNSGIRGTIGGPEGSSLCPVEIVKITSAYGAWISNEGGVRKTVAIGRDARISGQMVNYLVVGTLMAQGIDVIDLGLTTTPSVEMAVTDMKANG